MTTYEVIRIYTSVMNKCKIKSPDLLPGTLAQSQEINFCKLGNTSDTSTKISLGTVLQTTGIKIKIDSVIPWNPSESSPGEKVQFTPSRDPREDRRGKRLKLR